MLAAPIRGRLPTNLREALMSSAVTSKRTQAVEREGLVGSLRVPGNLAVRADAHALVLFAHGSGPSRLSPRNRAVATALNEQGIATLLFDLLTPEEEEDRTNVFDIRLLADRLVAAVDWVALN